MAKRPNRTVETTRPTGDGWDNPTILHTDGAYIEASGRSAAAWYVNPCQWGAFVWADGTRSMEAEAAAALAGLRALDPDGAVEVRCDSYVLVRLCQEPHRWSPTADWDRVAELRDHIAGRPIHFEWTPGHRHDAEAEHRLCDWLTKHALRELRGGTTTDPTRLPVDDFDDVAALTDAGVAVELAFAISAKWARGRRRRAELGITGPYPAPGALARLGLSEAAS